MPSPSPSPDIAIVGDGKAGIIFLVIAVGLIAYAALSGLFKDNNKNGGWR